MNDIVERIENNFINIYKKFDILDKKLNDYHMKFYKINEMIDIIISNEYTKIYKTYSPMKNYDLSQDRFFIYNEIINIPLKKNSYIIFEYVFNSEYINIPLVINLKIDDVLEKDFNIYLKKNNKIRHMFKLNYNITKINFYLYLYNNEIYSDEKMGYLKKILFNNKKEDAKITESQSNKLEQLENIDLSKLDKFSYYIKEFFMHNIDLVRRFEITSEKDYIQILQFEIDRKFLVNDIIKFFISIKLLYEDMRNVYWVLYFKMDVHYKDDVLIKSFKKQMTSKGFTFKNLATYNIDNMFKLNKDTDRLIFKLYMHKVSTAYKNNVIITLNNSLEENYCNLIWYSNIY